MTVYKAVSTFAWVGETWRDAENRRLREKNEELSKEVERCRSVLKDLEEEYAESESPAPTTG